jgi:alginate O-acetyltransferase complex protein AlgI
MSFLTVSFGLLLGLALLVFHSVPASWRPRVLLAVSLAFYCTWSPWHALLLVALTALVHRLALVIERSGEQRTKLRITALILALLVLLLVAFKCALAAVNALPGLWSRTGLDPMVWLAAPLGLSYYSFKLIGYVLDVYWENMPAQRDFTTLMLYSSFFPQLVSGPIQRAGDFFAQYDRLYTSDPSLFVMGLRRILLGLFKKIVVADQLSVAVTRAHEQVHSLSSLQLLLGAYFFSLQMYADFSGVTDIAIGIGQLFGITGPENFDRPYFARNLQEFWRRWHMSLTSWLTDYLFVPLRMAFRRLGNRGLALAIFVNMIAVGVWHGPRLTYLVFGCINGLFLTVSALTLKQRNTWFRSHATLAAIRNVAAPVVTFQLVVFTHVFFQAPDLPAALDYLATGLHLAPHAAVAPWHLDLAAFGLSPLRLGLALAALVLTEIMPREGQKPLLIGRLTASRRGTRWALYYGAALLVLLCFRGTTSFIYAKF